MLRTSRRVNIQSGGRVWQLVREQYLRDDIPCHSPLCFEGCAEPAPGAPRLPPPEDASCYLLPTDDVVRHYMDVLELAEIRGVIFTQTLVNKFAGASGKRIQRRIRNVVKASDKGSVFFANEFCSGACSKRKPEETHAEWQLRLQYDAAVWYRRHLGGQVPVVVLSEDAALAERYGHREPGVFVQSVDQYLMGFWPQLTAARQIHDSVRAMLRAGAGADKEEEQDQGVDNELLDGAGDGTREGGDAGDGEGEGYLAVGGTSDYLSAAALEAGIASGQFIKGHLKVNKYQPQHEAFVTRASAGAHKECSLSDVLVAGVADRNRAVHGDTVVVAVLPRAQWRTRAARLTDGGGGGAAGGGGEATEEEGKEAAGDLTPTGRVVGVLQRNWREYVVTMQTEEEERDPSRVGRAGWHLVVPFDRRIPKIRIHTRQADTLRAQRFVVRIDSWPVGSTYPQGHFVRSLGQIGDLETEIQVILAQSDISPRPFSQSVLSEMPVAEAWTPAPREVERRRDLRRSHLVFSIDPPGCEDVDDAMSVRALPGGRLEVGVHIADVTQFVAQGSATDLEARRRGTTVYLADRRFDMLPHVLSGDLCSLLGGVDRYAVSVLWELEPDTFRVLSVWYGRTLIRSSYKMFYEAAQRLADGESAEALAGDVPEWSGLDAADRQTRYVELRAALGTLTRLAHHLRSDRQQDGALELESSEVRFEFDEGGANQIKPKQSLEIHETVAEMMIFANHWVAQKIADTFPRQALLRRHGAARADQWEPVQRCAAARGWTVQVGSNRQVADSLDRCVDPADPLVNTILRLLATRAMVNAEYFSTGSVKEDQWGHYGLALQRYTHFTSPIRRYADVIVHRLLLAAVAAESSADQLPAVERGTELLQPAADGELQQLTDHLNERNRAAQSCQRDSQVLFQTLYFARRPADDPGNFVDGIIFSLRENGFLVHVPAYALRGPVYLQHKDGQVAWVCDERVSWESESRVLWVDGDVTENDTDLTVRCEYGEQVYRLLDHVTVHIRVLESTAHAHQLRFDLITNASYRASFRREAATAGERSTRQLIQEVTASHGARSDDDSESEDTPRPSAGAKSSLYAVLQKHRQRSLRMGPV